jgi:ribosomal protein S27AE
MSAIAGMMSALKGATDIATAMKDLRDATMVQNKVIELQAKILEAQAGAFAANEERVALLDKVRTLEREIAKLRDLKGTGEKCPRCGKNELRVQRSAPNVTFGDLGGRDYFLKCGACGYEDVQLRTP